LSNLANGNELAMVHLGTINEDEDDDEEDEKSFDAEDEAKKQKLAVKKAEKVKEALTKKNEKKGLGLNALANYFGASNKE